MRSNLCPSQIITRASIDNAIVMDMAMGGSSNTVLHLMAVANEAGIDYSINRMDEISRKLTLQLSVKLRLQNLIKS